jgi:hypothetical protein
MSDTRLQSRLAGRNRPKEGRRPPAEARPRLGSAEPRGAPLPTTADVIADLAALVTAGAIESTVDGAGTARYRVVDTFTGTSTFPYEVGGVA